MLTVIFITVIVFALVFALLARGTPSKLGHFIYHKGLPLEASLYGFKVKNVSIGELSMSLYDNEKYDKPTIVMLHGYTANKDVWVRFAKYFCKQYRVIIPDMAGHGDTEFKTGIDFGISAQTARIVALIDVLNISRVHIIGNSMGGFIAATFAKDYPGRTLSAALVDPAGVKSPELSDMDKMLAQGKNPFQIFNEQDFKHFYAMTMENPPYAPKAVLDVVSDIYQTRRAQYTEIFCDFHGSTMLDDKLKHITVPVLLLWGAKDRLIHVSATDVWRTGVSDIQITTWPDIGHMPMMEVPKKSAQRYSDFLTNLTEDSGEKF